MTMMLLAVFIWASLVILNVFKTTVAPRQGRVKGKIEHVQYIVVSRTCAAFKSSSLALRRPYSRRMSNRIARHFWHVAAIVLLGQSWNGTAAQSVGYSPVPRGIVESRVVKYAGDNRQREATLKQLFADAG